MGDTQISNVIEELKFYLSAGLPFESLKAWMKTLTFEGHAEVLAYTADMIKTQRITGKETAIIGRAFIAAYKDALKNKEVNDGMVED